ncbi:MAG: RNA polymerase sigma factor [Candidatus Promineifilaceae bacterium]
MATLPKQESGVPIHPADARTTEDDLTRLVAELFEQHHVAIYNYVYRLTGSGEWANDLTQETFLRLFRSRQKLPGIQNRRAWIYRLASNVTLNAIKRQNRFSWLPWKERMDDRLNATDSTAKLDQQEQVQQALNGIEPKYRAPLILYGQYELSVREIAEIMEISESNVKVRLHRARKMFRAAYGEVSDG